MLKSELFWNRNAIKYDKQEKKEEANITEYINKLSNELDSSYSILDFGCGNGSVTLNIAQHVKSIDAIDSSNELIKIANQNKQSRKIYNVNFMSVSIMDIEQGRYDSILCLYVLHLVDDLSSILKKCYELMNINGKIIITMPCMNGIYKFFVFVLNILSKINIVPPVKAYSKEEIIIKMKACGFELTKYELINSFGNQYLFIGKKT